ncbi:MAG: MarR family transcriptional regulator [Acidobacteriota bacterium]
MHRIVPTRPIAERLHDGLERLSVVLREETWRQAWPAELTATQVQVLRRIRTHAGSTLRQIAEALGIRDSTASEAVASLETKGLLSKLADPADRRRRLIQPTRRGLALLDAADGSSGSPLHDALDTLATERQHELVTTLQALIRSLQEAGRIPIAGTCTTCRFFRPAVHDDPRRPHHCDYVDAAFGEPDLRFDCPEHAAADGVG